MTSRHRLPTRLRRWERRGWPKAPGPSWASAMGLRWGQSWDARSVAGAVGPLVPMLESAMEWQLEVQKVPRLVPAEVLESVMVLV